MTKELRTIVILFAVLVLSIALGGSAAAQGNSKGKGKGKSESTDRGKSDKSDGTLWEGFPDDQNRNQNGNSKNARKDDKNNGSQRFKGLSKRTGYSQSTLQSRYEIERRLNPDLTYGQFVAAHMIAKNNKKVSTGDILNGLRNGKSIGQTLKERRWDKNKVDKERKRIRDIFKDDRDYDDRDPDWLF